MGHKKDLIKASSEQERVMQSEGGQRVGYYEDDEVRQATVHTRQDLVLIFNLVKSINASLYAIKYAIWLLIILMICLIWYILN